MIRVRWGVAGLALLGIIAGAVFFFLPSGPKKIEDFGPGLHDAAHLAATQALVAALPTPAGTTKDPYDTACITAVPLCFSSTLPTTTLLAEAKTLLTTAGATLLVQHCPAPSDQITVLCHALYDVNGAHVTVEVGAHGMRTPTGGTYLALIDGRPSALAGPSGAPKPVSSAGSTLGTWATENPFPADWRLSATCAKPTTYGCLDYRHLRTVGAPISGSLQLAQAEARTSLTAAGFRIDVYTCYPGTANSPKHCLVAGARFRNLGGTGSLTAVVSLQAEDADHVTATADVQAGLS